MHPTRYIDIEMCVREFQVVGLLSVGTREQIIGQLQFNWNIVYMAR